MAPEHANGRPGVDVVYVGTLPAHPGGSALSGMQLIGALARGGCRVRAVAPTTDATRGIGDQLVTDYPEIQFHRYAVPEFEIQPDRQHGAEYRAIEGAAVTEIVSRLVSEDPPEVIFLGRETFSWHLPEPHITRDIPCLLRAAGGGVNQLVTGLSPVGFEEHLRGTHMQVVPGRHMVSALRDIGCRDVRYVANPVDLDRFAPRPKPAELLSRLDIGADQIVVSHVSNLKPVKRPFDFVDAAEIVSSHVPEAVFLIVGDGPLREDVENRCRSLGIRDRVRFTEWLPYAEIPDVLRVSDVVAMCSEREGMARVYLETLACERTLVTSDIAPARELIEHGATGLIFPMGNVDALADCIVTAATDSSLRGRMGHAGRQSLSDHSLDRVGLKYAQLLRELADRGTGGTLTPPDR